MDFRTTISTRPAEAQSTDADLGARLRRSRSATETAADIAARLAAGKIDYADDPSDQLFGGLVSKHFDAKQAKAAAAGETGRPKSASVKLTETIPLDDRPVPTSINASNPTGRPAEGEGATETGKVILPESEDQTPVAGLGLTVKTIEVPLSQPIAGAGGLLDAEAALSAGAASLLRQQAVGGPLKATSAGDDKKSGGTASNTLPQSSLTLAGDALSQASAATQGQAAAKPVTTVGHGPAAGQTTGSAAISADTAFATLVQASIDASVTATPTATATAGATPDAAGLASSGATKTTPSVPAFLGDPAAAAQTPVPQGQAQAQAQLAANAAAAAAGRGAEAGAVPQSSASLPGTGIGAGTGSSTPAAAKAERPQAMAPSRFVVPQSVVADQISVHIQRAIRQGIDKIQIQMRPEELGRIDVKLEMQAADGKVQVVVRADKPETLDLLMRDAKALQQSLQDMGLDTGKDGLKFELRDGGGNRGEGRAQEGELAHLLADDGAIGADEIPADIVTASGNGSSLDRSIDITV